MLATGRVEEIIKDGLNQHHRNISAAAVASILGRFREIEHQCVLDTDVERDGLVKALLNNDRTRNPDDYRVVPKASELLAAELIKRAEAGIEVDPDAKISLYRQFERMSDEQRLESAEALNIKPDALASELPSQTSEAHARKRVVDMDAHEVEAEISLRWGPPPSTGRLTSDTIKYRKALIAEQQNAPDPRDVREVETAAALQRQRELSPAERISAHRASQRVSAE